MCVCVCENVRVCMCERMYVCVCVCVGTHASLVECLLQLQDVVLRMYAGNTAFIIDITVGAFSFSVPVSTPTPCMCFVGKIPLYYGCHAYLKRDHDQKVPAKEKDVSMQL